MSLETLQAIRFPNKIGGHIALDFTNTAEHRDSEQFRDSLLAYEHCLAWCWRSEMLSSTDAEMLYRGALQQPQLAERTFRHVCELRESIYQVFTAVINGQDWRPIDLTPLNDVLREGYPYRQLVSDEAGFTWMWDAKVNLAQPLWALAHAAAELLTSDQLSRVRQCPNCGWLFLNTSRNGLRRWCSMDYCGSQVKSRRQYERKKAMGTSPGSESHGSANQQSIGNASESASKN